MTSRVSCPRIGAIIPLLGDIVQLAHGALAQGAAVGLEGDRNGRLTRVPAILAGYGQATESLGEWCNGSLSNFGLTS